MKCQVVLRHLSQYLEHDLPSSQQEEMARHLEGCAACRAEAESLRAAERALQSLAATELAPELQLAGPESLHQ